MASEEINYRRFFDVNQLAALRMEDPAVFDEVHRFAFELVAPRRVTGLRIDHVDGLFAPGDYLRRLQERCAPTTSRFFIVVEKILGPGEQLPRDWPVHGTTGYEFAADRQQPVRRPPQRAGASTIIYRRFVRGACGSSFDDLAYRSKKQVLHETMSGDINSLGHQLNRFSERNRHFRDFTLYSLISTLEGSDRLVSRSTGPTSRRDEPVSEHDRALHRRGGAIARGGGRRRSAGSCSTSSSGCCSSRRPVDDAGRVRGARAVHRQVPADHRPGRGEGHRRTRRSTSTTGCCR